jgi:hypothetical protein
LVPYSKLTTGISVKWNTQKKMQQIKKVYKLQNITKNKTRYIENNLASTKNAIIRQKQKKKYWKKIGTLSGCYAE